MKVIILAGGYGTRIAEFTNLIPKPMVKIGGKPILWHIMNYYSKFSLNEFCIALGYKAEVIKEYFLNYHVINSDFTVDLGSGHIDINKNANVNWKVSLKYTGIDTLTGGRLKRLKEYINNETFMLTYGDGLCDVNISELLEFHKRHGKLATVTAVRPVAKFGELNINNDKVINFEEKPDVLNGWINGGYFIFEPEFLNLISNDETMLEGQPLSKAAEIGQLMAFKHYGFWQCMDSKRDKDFLEKMWQNNQRPWI